MSPQAVTLLRAILIMVLAIVLQTVVLGRIRFFGVGANIVVVMVILMARWLEPRVALLLGFTSGLVLDLLGGSTLGLRALVFTVVAYAALRLTAGAPLASLGGVWALSLLAEILLFVLGTLAGQGSLLQAELLQRALVVPLLNLGLAAVLFPLLARLLAPTDRGVTV
ncbi:MAG: rod shape-determining protein MreD [Acidimicrobiia bacterium]